MIKRISKIVAVICILINISTLTYGSPEEKYFRPSKTDILNNKNDNILSKALDDENITIDNSYLKTPEDIIVNYYSLLREAANPNEDINIGCGSLGWGKIPYKITYQFLSKEYQERFKFEDYEKEFLNILHINLLKYSKVNNVFNKDRYFYEIETIEGIENNISGFVYYYGFIDFIKDGEVYKINNIEMYPESYLCAPYHGWNYNGELATEIKYGQWNNLINGKIKSEIDGYKKYIYFNGRNNKKYRIEYYILTNDNDLEIAEYIKDNNGEWKVTRIK